MSTDTPKPPKEPKTRKRRRSFVQMFPMFGVLVFSVISFFATASGMHGLLTSLGKVHPYASYAMAGLFTLALQLFLVWAVRAIKVTPKFYAKAWWVGVYAICLFISVGFAYAFWFHAIAANQYSKETYETQARAQLYGLQNFKQQYAMISGTLLDMNDYSQRTSEEEIATGGTCGDNSGPTRGPRARLREMDARHFAIMAPHFELQQRGIDERINELERSLVTFDPDSLVAFQQIANRALIKARALRDDPQLRSMNAWLRQRLERGKSGFTAPSGEAFRCPDPYLEEQGEMLLAIALPDVPEDFVWFDPSQRQESVQLAFSRLLNLINVQVGSETAFLPKDVDALMEERLDMMEASVVPTQRPALIQDALPLIFGLVTDLLIFLAAMAAPWREQDFSEPLDSLSRLKNERPTLGRDFFLRMESFVDPKKIPESYRLLQEHAVTFGGTDYIMVPEPPMEERDIRTRYLMEFLVNAQVAEVFRPMLAGEKAPKAWARILAAKNIDDSDSFRLYRLKQGFLQAMAGELFMSQVVVLKEDAPLEEESG